MRSKTNKVIFPIFVLLAIISSLSFASDEISEAKILKQLEVIQGEGLETFIDTMESISKQSQEYIKLQEERCSGDYTSFVIDANGERKLQKNKLTKTEKKLCKYSLINFQIKVTKLAYKARVKYLEQFQKKQIEQLRSLNLRRLSELEQAAQKYK